MGDRPHVVAQSEVTRRIPESVHPAESAQSLVHELSMGAADAPMLEDDEDLAAHMSVRGLTGVRSGLVPPPASES